jgi:hypothetical protein
VDKPPDKPAVTEAEEARRIARIHREESRVAEAKRQVAEERKALQGYIQLKQTLDTIRQNPPTDKLRWIESVFGWNAQALLDDVVSTGVRTPEQQAALAEQQAKDAHDARLASLEQTVKNNAQSYAEERTERARQEYLNQVVAPAVADRAKFELTYRACGNDPQRVATEVLNYQFLVRQKENITPQQAAERIENYLKEQKSMLDGPSVKTEPAPQSTVPEPPKPAANGQQTHQSLLNAAFRPAPKPYTVKPVR